MLSNIPCAYFTSKQTCVKNYLWDGRLFITSSKEGREITVADELFAYCNDSWLQFLFQSILSALTSPSGESALPSPQMIPLPPHIRAWMVSGVQGLMCGFASGWGLRISYSNKASMRWREKCLTTAQTDASYESFVGRGRGSSSAPAAARGVAKGRLRRGYNT